MYNGIQETDGSELLVARLEALEQELRALDLPTREELLAEVYSRLNAVLKLGNRVSPLAPIAPEGPAVAADVYENLQRMNADGLAISEQLLAMENEAARLLNLFAATQNSLRQMVREQVYQPTKKRYLEPFISSSKLDPSSTAMFDFSAGAALLPTAGEEAVAPSRVDLGVLCEGSLEGTLDPLMDGKTETSMVWNGSQLDLIFTFETPRILNRFKIELDSYQGLNLEQATSSPDGILHEDLLVEQSFANRSIDGSSNKFSGDFTMEFDARHVKQLRLVLSDRVGDREIRLRGISFSARRYRSAAVVQSADWEFPELGLVLFATDQHTAYPLTAITHQISYDGMQYQAIIPGQTLDIGGRRCWYRAFLERIDDNFKASDTSPLEEPGLKPELNSPFKLLNAVSTKMGNSLIQRSLTVNLLATNPPTNAARLVDLRETPLPGTLMVMQGSALLGPEQYGVYGTTLSFSGDEARMGLVIRYQIPSDAQQNLVARKEYFTPRLYRVSFERAA